MTLCKLPVGAVAGHLRQALACDAGPLGANRPGFDDDHVDAETCDLDAQAIAQTFYREFGGVIPAAERLIRR
jgi:hypothetical protein